MARGGKRGHKGGTKRFTNPEMLEQQRIKAEKEKAWRRQRGYETESSSEDESDEEEEESSSSGSEDGIAFDRSGDGAKPSKSDGGAKGEASSKKKAESDEDSSSSDDEDAEPAKRKGAEGLIETANPNAAPERLRKPKEGEEAAAATGGGKPQLSRREREEIEKQRAKAHYQKLHAAGKTDEAKADLARLAIVRKQREDAAKKREMEAKAKDEAAKVKKEATVAMKKGKK